MDIKKAIESIASGDTVMAIVARESLKSDENYIDFTQYITDQFNQGNAATMAASYGHEVVDTIIKHGKSINIAADFTCMNACLKDDK